MSAGIRIDIVSSLAEVPPAEWDALAGGSPFLSHHYLYGLERHDCLAPQGWHPAHVLARRDRRLVAAMPLYLKTNSFGEFVFDWSWADAWERAGGRYYPKLVSAVPFAPVVGPRLLTAAPERLGPTLVQAAIELAREQGLSSLHCLFADAASMQVFERMGLVRRASFQFHWHNRGYADFEDFLSALTSRRRKEIRRERRKVAEAGLEVRVLHGGELGDDDWRHLHRFYCATFRRRWGEPRLTLPFFRHLGRCMGEQVVVAFAWRQGEPVAAAFALRDDTTLYGRHWGCGPQYRFLHFELCYYRLIDYCIAHGLRRFDAGVQGEHKLARGFEPVPTWSAHWLCDSGFNRAVADFCRRERQLVEEELATLAAHGAYRDDQPPSG